MRANLALLALFVSGAAVQYAVLPLVLLPQGSGWAWLLLPITLATPSFWALAHEAMHGVFHPDRRINDAAGRLMGILYGASFRVLRFGHLMHHRFSRTSFDCSELYDPRRTSRTRAFAIHYARILFGLYAVEVLGNLIALLPRPWLRPVLGKLLGAHGDDVSDVPRLAEHALAEGGRLAEIRLDSLLVLLLLGGSFWLYGDSWIVLAASLAGRGLLVSLLDNAPHYGTPAGDRDFSYNLGLPGPLSALLLHFNLHRVHHRHPHLPWTALPIAFAESDGRHDGPWLVLVLRQLRGPLPRHG